MALVLGCLFIPAFAQTNKAVVVTNSDQLTITTGVEAKSQQSATPIGNQALNVTVLDGENVSTTGVRLSPAELTGASSLYFSAYVNVARFESLAENARLRFAVKPRNAEGKVLESGNSTTSWFTASAIRAGGVKTSEGGGIANALSVGSKTVLNGESWVFIVARFEGLPAGTESLDVLIQFQNVAANEQVQLAGLTIIPQ